jgi:hypothetical protein
MGRDGVFRKTGKGPPPRDGKDATAGFHPCLCDGPGSTATPPKGHNGAAVDGHAPQSSHTDDRTPIRRHGLDSAIQHAKRVDALNILARIEVVPCTKVVLEG